MRITVHAKPGSKKAALVRRADAEYEIAVPERPEKGRANNAIRRMLARELGIPQSRLSIVMGASSSRKVFEIL